MFDLPLHPIAVHIPIALGFLLPLLGVVSLVAIRKGLLPEKTWILLVFISAIYLGSSVLAIELGERDEDLIEQVVGKRILHKHEEAGEKVPWAAGVILLTFTLPLVFEKKGRFQVAAIAVSSLGLIPLVNAGHTGGELVYKYGAANVHVERLSKPIKSNNKIKIDEETYDED